MYGHYIIIGYKIPIFSIFFIFFVHASLSSGKYDEDILLDGD